LAGGGHFLSDRGGEGNDVMLHLAFDLVNARDVEGSVLAQRARGIRGNFAGLGQRFSGRQLYRQPLLEAILIAENAAHFGPGVSWDHFSVDKALGGLRGRGLGLGNHQARKQTPAIEGLRGHQAHDFRMIVMRAQMAQDQG
jgi:hypothetical protein